LNRKKSAYQRFGVQSYWIVDPNPQEPSITLFELRDGRYALRAKVAGSEMLQTDRPFDVKVIPAILFKGLLYRARN
jgi:Uma2 family endonuclease